MLLLKLNLLIASLLLMAFNTNPSQKQPRKAEFAVNQIQSLSTIDLQGTVWKYEDEDMVYDIVFGENGTLVSSHPHDITPENDAWSQDGETNTISFSYNNNFSVYEGTLVNESLIVGKAHNRSFSWEWKAYRVGFM
ncbi:hypothetical protein [Flexithrix dorotheae]|uniref:hypothetical protein n=1 Tax=Flexithrix dorotheae TaxID=70993 RepID=UPI0012F90AAF|nr:hypothetical protein [Flexithrix dorotheae]